MDLPAGSLGALMRPIHTHSEDASLLHPAGPLKGCQLLGLVNLMAMVFTHELPAIIQAPASFSSASTAALIHSGTVKYRTAQLAQ